MLDYHVTVFYCLSLILALFDAGGLCPIQVMITLPESEVGQLGATATGDGVRDCMGLGMGW